MTASRRWVVDAHSPKILSDVLHVMDADTTALHDGRVFVGRKRIQDGAASLSLGDLVEVFAPLQSKAAFDRDVPAIISEDHGIVAAYKPAWMPTIADHHGVEGTLQAWVTRELARKPDDPVHVTSRLDVGVSGVVLFAASASARRVLQEARDTGQYKRHYVAIAHGMPSLASGIVDLPIGRATDPRRRRVDGSSAVSAQSRFRLVDFVSPHALLAVEPITGRTHQIRVHMAHIGAPLLGDRAYKGPLSLVLPSGKIQAYTRIFLHAAWVSVLPAGRAKPFRADAPAAKEMIDTWQVLGGSLNSWTIALDGL